MAQVKALGGEGEFFAYVAAPEGTPRAAIIVIPEIFGINPGIRQKCDRLAATGYLAVAPEIFWRFAPGVELDPERTVGGSGIAERERGAHQAGVWYSGEIARR